MSFCDDPVLPDAPISVCRKHAGRLLTYITDRVGEDGDDWRDAVDLLPGLAEVSGLPGSTVARYRPPAPLPHPGGKDAQTSGAVVYYLQLGGLVKIGTTKNLVRRLAKYPPHVTLLATEPGHTKTEAERHAQFHELRAYPGRLEWFYYGRHLSEHIDNLQTGRAEGAESVRWAALRLDPLLVALGRAEREADHI